MPRTAPDPCCIAVVVPQPILRYSCIALCALACGSPRESVPQPASGQADAETAGGASTQAREADSGVDASAVVTTEAGSSGGAAGAPAEAGNGGAGPRGSGDASFKDLDAGSLGCDVQEVMARPENACTSAGCHGSARQGGLDLRGADLAERLVGVASQGAGCRGEPLIDPTAPSESLFLRKVDSARYAATPTCGALMPIGHEGGVSAADLACFEAWVQAEAAGAEAPSSETFESLWQDSPVESALLKVKALVSGEPLTQQELQLAQQDPTQIEALVSSWASGPSFNRKLRGFLANALQQKSTGNVLVDQADILNFPRPIRERLLENLEQSFVRTASRIVEEGRPFSEVVTTTTWDATTAMLVLLSYTERDDTERRARNHWVYNTAPPEGAPTTPPTQAQSIETGFWFAPDYPADCPSRQLNESNLFDLLFGRSNCPQGAYLPSTPLLSGTDYEDWRQVDLIPAENKQERLRFWDLPALRAATALHVRLPRVGFFTTPAFLDNWPTNDDNQFRVTASQTMIAALGTEFFAGDNTTPLTLAGLDAVHSEEGTACYSCHILLDPMRNYFSGQFDADYQVQTTPSAAEAGFAFLNHASAGGTLYDFANELSTHPHFATAWAQKLCHYANSQACDETDPAFIEVVEAFTASNLDFKTLLVKLLSSPLVTGLKYSETYASREWLVSITRQDHLCARLDAHLKQANVCGEASAFIGLIPEDEFARGQSAPVQTAVTSAFHATATEALCERLSRRLVGGQDGRPFPVATPEESLTLMVDAILGLPQGHSRRDVWRARLSAHYEEARTIGANRGQALRSAFILACVSPEVMALGL